MEGLLTFQVLLLPFQVLVQRQAVKLGSLRQMSRLAFIGYVSRTILKIMTHPVILPAHSDGSENLSSRIGRIQPPVANCYQPYGV